MTAPFQCKFCGAPSWVDPSDQTAPADYCHPADHGADPGDEVKRYDVHIAGGCCSRGCNPYPDPFESVDGIWVDYNDHRRIVEHLQAEHTRAILRYTLKGYQAGENTDAKHWRQRAEIAESAAARLAGSPEELKHDEKTNTTTDTPVLSENRGQERMVVVPQSAPSAEQAEVAPGDGRAARLQALLLQIRGWDMLDACADGPFWKAKIDKELARTLGGQPEGQ